MGARPFCARAAPRPGCAWPRSHSAAPFARTRGRSVAVADLTRTPSVRAQLASAFVPGPARVHAGRSVAVTNPTRTPSLRAQLAVAFVPGLARAHVGAFRRCHRLHPDPFALSLRCVREGSGWGQCASCAPACKRGGQWRGAARYPGESGDWLRQGGLWGLAVPPLLPSEGKGDGTEMRGAPRGREWGLVGLAYLFHIPVVCADGMARANGGRKEGWKGY